MDFSEVTRSRRTVGAYDDRPVDDELVRRALSLSLWAPNHRLTFPIRYTLVGPEVRRELANLAIEIKSERGPMSEVAANAMRTGLTRSSHLVALGLNRSADPGVAHEDYATLACAVQIATTLLWGQGVASKWSTARWTVHPKAYAALRIDPERVKLEGCLMIGYAAAVPRASERPNLDEVLTRTT